MAGVMEFNPKGQLEAAFVAGATKGCMASGEQEGRKQDGKPPGMA
jgi:hypothetical protein